MGCCPSGITVYFAAGIVGLLPPGLPFVSAQAVVEQERRPLTLASIVSMGNLR